MINPLKSSCVDNLLENLNIENVMPVLQYCLNRDVDERLVQKCRSILRSNIDNVLKPEFIPTMNVECLTFLLEDDGLIVKETDLFNAVCFDF